MSAKRNRDEEGGDVSAVTSKLRDQVDIIIEEAKKEAKAMKETAAAEIAAWEAEKKDIYKTRTFEPIITLNVGGTSFSTTLKTLTSLPDSTLGKMFSGHHELPKDQNGAYFIDRSPLPFAEILAFVRSPTQYHPPVKNEDLMVATALEAEFLGIKSTIWAPSSYTFNGVDIAVRHDGTLWYLLVEEESYCGSGIRNGWHAVNMCKHGCGCGVSAKADSKHAVKNFAAGRVIDATQPTMQSGTVCIQCNKLQ